MIKETGVSNKFETFQSISGETVKGVLNLRDGEHYTYLVVFESGWSLEIHSSNAAYWLNSKAETASKIRTEQERRKGLIENLAEVSKLLEPVHFTSHEEAKTE
jgi:hypothetical protein